MAFITAETRSSIVELAMGMLNQAPSTAMLNTLIAKSVEGASIQDLADYIATTDAFTAEYPATQTAREFATEMFGKLITGGTLDADINTAVIDLLEGLLIAGTTKAQGFVAVIEFLANPANVSHPDLGDISQSFQNRADAAEYFSITKELGGSTDAELAAAIASVTSDADTLTAANAAADATADAEEVVAGQTFTLTTSVDKFTGLAGDDTFNLVKADGTTLFLTALDVINGGDGDDTISAISVGALDLTAAAPASAKISNVENVVLEGGDALTANTSTWTGVTSLSATNVAAQTLTAAATTDVVSSVTGQAASAISVTGGKDVTINATGVTTGTTGATSVSGTVNITAAGATAGNTTMGQITVTGGTTVNVTTSEAASSNAAHTDTQSQVDVTGTAATTAVTVSQTAAAAAGTKGAIANGIVNILDVNRAEAAKAGAIAEVTLNSFGAATVNSGALTTLNLSGTGTSVTATTLGALTVPNKTLNINVNGLTTTGAVGIDTDITTINIDSSTKASTIASLADASATALNISGDAKLTLTAQTIAATAVVTSTNTAGVKLGTALATGSQFVGGDGDDTITLSNGFTKAITTGAGDDTVTYAGPAGTGGSLNTGDGEDTLVMTGAVAATASATATFNTKVSGFENVLLTDGAAIAVNLAGLGGIESISSQGSTGVITVNSFVSGGTLNLTGAGTGDLTLVIANAALTTDTVNVNLVNSTAGVVGFGTATAADVETVNINTVDKGTGTSAAATIDTATLVATSAKTVVVAGNNGLTLTNAGNTAITSFDASGVVADSAATVDTAANLAVTFLSANVTAAASVTIKGGSGNDTLTGVGAKDTIYGNGGNDIIGGGAGADILVGGDGDDSITGGTGVDTMTGGAGDDTFVIAAGDAGITGVEAITDFEIALSSDKLDLSTTTLIADAAAANVNAAVAGAVDVTATVKNGIITIGGADAGLVDTIGELKAIFELLDDNAAADTAAIVMNGHTYVLTDTAAGAVNDIIQLSGVTTATAMSAVDAANSIFIA